MRKFRCPFCEFEHTFSPGGKNKHRKKRVVGFTCPRCGKKATEKDLRKSKGKGPKPKGQRRNRKKKSEKKPPRILPAIDPLAPKLDNKIITFRRRIDEHRHPTEVQHPSANQYWQPRPTSRTLGDAALLSTNIKPAGFENVKILSEPLIEGEKIDKASEAKEAVSIITSLLSDLENLPE